MADRELLRRPMVFERAWFFLAVYAFAFGGGIVVGWGVWS